MGSMVDHLVCLECECHLKPLYLGQATFFDLYTDLSARGLVLRDLQSQGPFEGEALEFNSFWSREPQHDADLRILDLWEAANGIRKKNDFAVLDAIQRKAYRFNA
jgi:hypothetical protein